MPAGMFDSLRGVIIIGVCVLIAGVALSIGSITVFFKFAKNLLIKQNYFNLSIMLLVFIVYIIGMVYTIKIFNIEEFNGMAIIFALAVYITVIIAVIALFTYIGHLVIKQNYIASSMILFFLIVFTTPIAKIMIRSIIVHPASPLSYFFKLILYVIGIILLISFITLIGYFFVRFPKNR